MHGVTHVGIVETVAGPPRGRRSYAKTSALTFAPATIAIRLAEIAAP
jgi:hypothetical protein